MQIGSLASAASLAGSRLAQAQSAANQEAGETAQLHRAAAAQHAAEAAAGISATEHELTTSERDADGRQPWRFRDGLEDDAEPEQHPAASESDKAPAAPQSEGGAFEIWV